MQMLPIQGLVIVSAPQDLVSMVVEKSLHMAEVMKIPVVGLLENMSYALCPNCEEKHYIFGQGRVEETAQQFKLPFLGSLPIDSTLTAYSDEGKIEEYGGENFLPIANGIVKNLQDLLKGASQRIPLESRN